MKLIAAPVLETERLTLRSHGLGDFEASVAMWADPIVVRYIGGKPSTPQESWFRLLRYVGHWPLVGYGYWAVEEKASGSFIGEVGFADFRRDIDAIRGIPELGWALAPGAHGKGYATEALRAALAWGDRHLETSRTVCIIDPENTASLRVADKIGYRAIDRLAFNGRTTIVFERT